MCLCLFFAWEVAVLSDGVFVYGLLNLGLDVWEGGFTLLATCYALCVVVGFPYVDDDIQYGLLLLVACLWFMLYDI